MQQNTLTPFRQGQYLAYTLFKCGAIDRGTLLTEKEAAHEDAQRYARYAAPGGSPETVRTIAGGLLYQWAKECDRERRKTL